MQLPPRRHKPLAALSKGRRDGKRVEADRVLRLIAQLTAGLPQPVARRLRLRLARLVVRSHQVDHLPPPGWVIELRRLLVQPNRT